MIRKLVTRLKRLWAISKNCDKVKAANNGYPEFWFETIVLSGVLAETRRNWG